MALGVVLLSTCCSGSDSRPNPDKVISLEILERDVDDFDVGDAVTTGGYVIWEKEFEPRLCDSVLESYPVQCGRPDVALANRKLAVFGDVDRQRVDGGSATLVVHPEGPLDCEVVQVIPRRFDAPDLPAEELLLDCKLKANQ